MTGAAIWKGAKITLNEYLDRWLDIAVGPRVRPKTFQDYLGMLHRYVRPVLGDRILAALRPLDLQAMYQHMNERGLSSPTIRYAHVLMKGAMHQAVRWHLLLENPADGLKVPQQVRNEMRSLTIEPRGRCSRPQRAQVWASTRSRTHNWYAPE